MYIGRYKLESFPKFYKLYETVVALEYFVFYVFHRTLH